MEGFVVTWWMWFLFGLLLLLAEFTTPGAFYQFFFGLGAIAVGLLVLVGIPLPLSVQLLLFIVLSIGSLLLLRKHLRLKLSSNLPDNKVDTMEGEAAVALDDIPANAVGKAELRGTTWEARNVGDGPITKSQRCRVMRVDSLTLWIISD
ncbi:MAG: NfeD family protein [bacterium]|nr:NfeD family protein [bacterium]